MGERAHTEVPGSSTRPDRWFWAVAASVAYLIVALVVWGHVWTGHPSTTTTCGCGDSSLFTWFLEWPAYALSHGLSPLYSKAMLFPTGVSLLSNTAVLALGVVLAPVTLAFGPVATLNVALTASPVLSALAMFVLLRRWTSWAPAAFVGGLLYGFSPFVLASLSDSHLMLGAGFVLPLLVACIDEILFRQKRRPVVTGAVMGVLIAIQFFLGTELLAITAISCAVGVVLVLGYALLRRARTRVRIPYVAAALGSAAVTAGALLAYPIWFTLAGPAHFNGSVWPPSVLGRGGISIGELVSPARTLHSMAVLLHHIGGYQGPALSGQYLGAGLVVVVVGGSLAFRRDRRLWLFGAIGLVSMWLSLGLENSFWVPWHLLVKIPLVQNIIPGRFMAAAYLALAVSLGIIVDHTYAAVRARVSERSSRSSGPADSRGAAWAGAMAGTLAAAVALVPIVVYLAQSIPMTTQPVVLPRWFQSIAPHLEGHQVLLVFPSSLTLDTLQPLQSAMTWQAVDKMSYSMVGAGGPAARLTPSTVQRRGQVLVTELLDPFGTVSTHPDDIHQLRRALEAWGVTMVVVPDQAGLPAYEQAEPIRSIAMAVTAALGAGPHLRAGAWVWSDVEHAGPARVPTAAWLTACAATTPPPGAEAVTWASQCVLSGPRSG